jgi:RNA polymerase sigma-70 factor (ECF subfamily)
VVQETWIALLRGIDGFEGRSSLRTWLFAVMINIAKRRGARERRVVDIAVVAYTGGTVDPARFCACGDEWPGRPRSASCSTSASRTSACCFIEVVPRSGTYWRTI